MCGRGLLTLLAATLAFWCQVATAESLRLTLLHINDVYEISPRNGSGGLAPLMTLLKAERARAGPSLTTFGGDLISPSVLSGLTQGRQMIALMNAIGVDAAGLGNHEFDFGPEVLRQRMSESRFPWLVSNTLGADGKPFGGAAAALSRRIGGLKVGLLALLTPATAVLSSPGPTLRFLPPEPVARAAVARLRADGADLVLALTHQSLAEDRALARAVRGIDVILGGHEHDPISFYEGGVLIVKAGADARYLAVVDLTVEKRQEAGQNKVSVRPEWRFLSTAGVPPDPDVAHLVDGYEAQLAQVLGDSIATAGVALDLTEATLHRAESNFADLVADALRRATGADVALINAGSLRGDRSIAAGTAISRKDVLAALPFRNVAVLLEVSGETLKAALEHGVAKVEEGSGGFPQVSGLSFTYDPALPAGARIVEVAVGGKPLEPGARYRLATNDYLARGGDGYAMLAGAKTVVDASGGPLLTTVVMDDLAARSRVTPEVEGRIRRR